MKRIFNFLVSAALAIMLTACGEVGSENTNSLDVHFIDVGQGDAALVMSKGEAMLIDGGNASDSSLIYSYLNDRSVDHLEYIIASHAHEDHMGGLSGALEKASVGKIYLPQTGADGKFYKKFLEKAAEKNIEMVSPKSGESFTLGSCKVELMTPSGDFSHEVNNTSIITKVTCGERSFLFTGDAEREEEEDILAQGLDISATVLKAGHHGSDTSSTYPFLREVMPEVVIISVGAGNEYGHPHEEVMSRFHDLGAQVYRTDESGHIVIHTDGESLAVSQRKGTKPEPTQSAMEENDAEDAVTEKENINKPEYEVPDDVAPEAQDEVKEEAVNTTESEPKQRQEEEAVSKEEAGSAPEESTEVAAGAVAQTGISQEAEENAIQQTEVKSEGKYIGNKNSKKLHLPTCGSLPKEKNRKYFTNAEEAYGMGYVGCKLCMD